MTLAPGSVHTGPPSGDPCRQGSIPSVLGATRPCSPACSLAQAGCAGRPGTRCLNKGAPLPERGPPKTVRAPAPRPSRRLPAAARPLAAAPAPRRPLPAPTLPPIINKHFCFAIKEQRWRIILARAALAYVSMDINLKIKSMPPPPGAGGSAAARPGEKAQRGSRAGGGCAVAAPEGALRGAQPAGPYPRAKWGTPGTGFPRRDPSPTAPRPPQEREFLMPPPSSFKKYPRYLCILKIRFLATARQTSKLGRERREGDEWQRNVGLSNKLQESLKRTARRPAPPASRWPRSSSWTVGSPSAHT